MDPAAATSAAPDWRAALAAAAYAFVLSRLVVLLAGALAIAHGQQWSDDFSAEASLRPFTVETVAALEERVLSNDGGWYGSIALGGYAQRPFDTDRNENWAFFPLHPWLWRLAMATGLEVVPAGLILANLFFLLGLVQAHRWLQLVADGDVANRAILCLAFFPSAYFYSLPWSESLFLFLLASGLLATEQRRWGAAAIYGGFASGTRLVGLGVAAIAWLRGRVDPTLPATRRWLYAGVGTLGLLAFVVVLWRACGNPLAFADIQVTWGRNGGSLFKHFRRWFADPGLVAGNWNVYWLTNTCALLGLAAAATLWRHGQRALAGFVLFCVLLPWSSGTLISMQRYVGGCLPVFLAFAWWLRRPAAFLAWLLASTAMLAWLSAVFFTGATYAGA